MIPDSELYRIHREERALFGKLNRPIGLEPDMPRKPKPAPPPPVPTPPAGQHVTRAVVALLSEWKEHGFKGVRFCQVAFNQQEHYSDEMTVTEFAAWLANYANFVLQPDELIPFGSDLIDSEYIEVVADESRFMDDVCAEIKRRCGGDVRVKYSRAYDFEVIREMKKDVASAPASGEGDQSPPPPSSMHDDDDDVDVFDDTDLEPAPPSPLVSPPIPAARLVGDLATLVRRLVRRLANHEPGLKLVQQAGDFLKRYGLQGSILRDVE